MTCQEYADLYDLLLKALDDDRFYNHYSQYYDAIYTVKCTTHNIIADLRDENVFNAKLSEKCKKDYFSL